MFDVTRRNLVKLLGATGLTALAGLPVSGEEYLIEGKLSIAGGRVWLDSDTSIEELGPFLFDSGAKASTVWRNVDRFVAEEAGRIDVASIGETVSRARIETAPIPLNAAFSIPSHIGITSEIDYLLVSDVVLGTAAFSNHVLSLDFSRNSFSISDKQIRRENYPGYFRAKIFRFGQVFTRFNNSRVNGEYARGILDTGSKATTLFPKIVKRLDILGTASALGPATYVTGSTGKLSKAQYVKVPRLEIANETFENHWCIAITDDDFVRHGSAEYLIGMDVASQFHIIWDLIGARQVFLRRLAPQPAQPLKVLDKKIIVPREGSLWVCDAFNLEETNFETLEDVFAETNPMRVVKIPGVDFSRPDGAFQYARYRDETASLLKMRVQDGAELKDIEISQRIIT